MSIHVGSVILKMIWISLNDARTALVVGLNDGSILLYLYWAPSHLSKFRNLALGLLPFKFVGFLYVISDYSDSQTRRPSLQRLLLVQ